MYFSILSQLNKFIKSARIYKNYSRCWCFTVIVGVFYHQPQNMIIGFVGENTNKGNKIIIVVGVLQLLLVFSIINHRI